MCAERVCLLSSFCFSFIVMMMSLHLGSRTGAPQLSLIRPPHHHLLSSNPRLKPTELHPLDNASVHTRVTPKELHRTGVAEKCASSSTPVKPKETLCTRFSKRDSTSLLQRGQLPRSLIVSIVHEATTWPKRDNLRATSSLVRRMQSLYACVSQGKNSEGSRDWRADSTVFAAETRRIQPTSPPVGNAPTDRFYKTVRTRNTRIKRCSAGFITSFGVWEHSKNGAASRDLHQGASLSVPIPASAVVCTAANSTLPLLSTKRWHKAAKTSNQKMQTRMLLP